MDSTIRHPSRWARRGWVAAGMVCLILGTIGIVVPLLPTVDFYVAAAFCLARGSQRWEHWLMSHPRIGPMVHQWRANRCVPLKAKCLATLSMSASCAWAAYALPSHTAWIPTACCALVAAYLWSRPSRPAHAGAPAGATEGRHARLA